MTILGIYETTRLPIDAVPDITNNQVQIITQAPSYGALDIEQLVTFPIEQSCNNISGLKEIRSFSRFGLSLVTIVFEDDIDIYWARQQVSERLINARAVIPEYIGVPELGPISTGLGEIYQYVIRPQKGYEGKYSITELRTIQDWIVRRQLLGVKGVAEVSSFGGKLKQYEVNIIPEKLLAMNVTIDEVFLALEKNNQNTGGGYIEKGPNVIYIRSEGLISSSNDIENIAVLRRDGSQIMMRDIAEVKIGHATRYGAMCYNDQGEVSGAIVMMLKGANSSEVIENIKEKVEEIKKTLPEGIIIEPFLDRTKMVNNAIHTVRNNLVEGALIVLFVLVLFLGNWRAGCIVASVIPLSLLFAIILMNFFGVSGNLMSLGALDFGLIVDGAVIIVEAVVHQLSHRINVANRDKGYVDNIVVHTGSRMMKSALFGQLIILMVYIPIFSLEGIEGKMFKPMAQTVSFALLGAFLLSLTYIPMMSAWLLDKDIKGFNFSERWIHNIEKVYLKSLEKAIIHSKKIIAISLIIFIISIGILSQLGGEFIPTLEEDDFAVDTRVLTGSHLNTTIEYTQKAAGALKKNYPEVEMVVTKIGSGEVPTDPMPMEASDMMVILKDKSKWTSADNFDELAEKMSTTLAQIPGITYGFQYPVQMRFNELMTGSRQDVVCKIFGENLDTLALYAEKLAKISHPIKGVENIYVEPISGMPQIIISYNRQQLAYNHLTIEDVNQVVNTALAGKSAGMIFEDEKRFELVVKLAENQRDIEHIEQLMIPTPNGSQIELRQVANIEMVNGPNQIQREDAKRRIVIGFNVRNRDVKSLVNELKEQVSRDIKLPSGYFIHYGGAFENLEQATKRLSVVVPISLLMIFLMLYFAFGQVRLAVMIYSAIPLSAIGGIWFLAMRGLPFSISAGIGFIALFGVAVLNGIVLISEFHRLRQEGKTDIRQIVFEGAKTRLRPVLMTALVASLGFFPMAFSNGAGAEVQRPLATVVIGGLIVATILTLFILPIIYIMFESKSIFKSKTATLTSMIIFCILSNASFSQSKSITLSSAIDSALKNNLVIQNSSIQSQIKKEFISSAADIPKTNFSTTLGQYNSSYFDNNISISQTIPLPTTSIRLRQLYRSEYQLSLLEKEMKIVEVKKMMTQYFYLYSIYKKKEALWLQTDSILTQLIDKMNIRYQKGDINLLEKTSAEQQQSNIRFELEKIKVDLEEIVHIFNYFLQTSQKFTPEIVYTHRLVIASENGVHPMLSYQKLLIQHAEQKTKYIQALRWPDISLGLSSTTIQGVGADNESYTAGHRFNSINLGLAFPIFNRSNKIQAKASKLEEKTLKNNYELKRQQKEHIEHHFTQQFTLYSKQVETYESTQLKNAETLLKLSSKQLLAGEINYLEWASVSKQSIEIRQNYLDALKNLYENYCNLQYLSFEEFK